MFRTNLVGIVIFLIGFGVALLVKAVSGVTAEGPLMLVGGPLCLVMDVAYRSTRSERHWFKAETGGVIFSIPLWIFGIVWVVIGIIYIINGRNSF